MRRIRESPQTLRRKPRHFLPSAPDLVITGCVSPAGGGAHQIEGVDRMDLLLFSLPLVICAREAPSEAEGAEREAGHIRRLPELPTQFSCGNKERKAKCPAHLAEMLGLPQQRLRRPKRLFFWTVHGPFSFGQDQKKMGGGSHSEGQPLQKRRSLTAPPVNYCFLG